MEIPGIQLMSALYMGNRPLVKVDSKVQIVCEQFVRMLVHHGLPAEDLDFIYSDGPVMNDVILRGRSRMCLFTGSQGVAEKLVKDLRGRIKLEDAGFDWKILGPDVPPEGSKNYDFAVWQADQDAYGFSGQKCSAQSILFAHKNWVERGFLDELKERVSALTLFCFRTIQCWCRSLFGWLLCWFFFAGSTDRLGFSLTRKKQWNTFLLLARQKDVI